LEHKNSTLFINNIFLLQIYLTLSWWSSWLTWLTSLTSASTYNFIDLRLEDENLMFFIFVNKIEIVNNKIKFKFNKCKYKSCTSWCKITRSVFLVSPIFEYKNIINVNELVKNLNVLYFVFFTYLILLVLVVLVVLDILQ
jgi:hypothetical protein